jgi:hypothetical protein
VKEAQRTRVVRLLAISVGALLAFGAVAALEFASLQLNLRAESRLRREGTYVQHYFVYDERLGYKPRASQRTTHRFTADGRVVYDVVYTTDERSRRVTPPAGGSPERYALFFGCSVTFGEGVADDETLPAQLGRARKDLRPYNYGFSGYGPQEALARLEDPAFRREVNERDGVAVFTYVDGTEERVVGSFRVYTGWGYNMPRYVLDDSSRPVRVGSFTTSRPFLSAVYKWLAMSETLRLLRVDFPPFRTEHDYELTARVLAAARDAYVRSFGNDRFYVLMFPARRSDDRIRTWLSRLGVRTLDYSSLFDPDAPTLALRSDRHPTPKAYGIVAERLARDLR